MASPTPTPSSERTLISETQPLLSSSPKPDAYKATGPRTEVVVQPVPVGEEAIIVHRNAWANVVPTLWRILAILVGSIILGVFIKGFIDADDVDVSESPDFGSSKANADL